MLPSLSTIIRTHSASARDLVLQALVGSLLIASVAVIAKAKAMGLVP